jgi:hypothetical protein
LAWIGVKTRADLEAVCAVETYRRYRAAYGANLNALDACRLD